MLAFVSDLLAVSGPATANSVTDEARFFGLGALLLYPIIFNKFINKNERIPTQFIILISGLIIVPIFGKTPLQASDQFVHITHLVSLNLILFSSGLETKFSSIRSILRYGIVLSTVGIAVSTAIIGLLLYVVVSDQFLGLNNGMLGDIPISVCMLIGASLSSTDACASISILSRLRTKLPDKVLQIIKFESSINDPAAVIIYGMIASWIFRDANLAGNINTNEIATKFDFQAITDNFVGLFSTGTLVGFIFGYFSIWMLKNLALRKQQLLTAGLAIVSLNYAISNFLGGSGLISAFIAGMVLSNLHKSAEITIIENMKESLEPFEELAEIFIYCSFAARVDPESLFRMLPWGLICAFIMMVIARPLSIFIFQPFSRLKWREASLLGWCGLKGAVTLALSFEMIEVISRSNLFETSITATVAQDIQSVIFITAITNLLIQSLSIPAIARWASKGGERETINGGISSRVGSPQSSSGASLCS